MTYSMIRSAINTQVYPLITECQFKLKKDNYNLHAQNTSFLFLTNIFCYYNNIYLHPSIHSTSDSLVASNHSFRGI